MNPMTEDCTDEEARLLQRTAELKARTEALDLSVRPFLKAEHDALREDLHQHRLALADFRRRCLDAA
jgi:hypothetical protein